MFHDLNTMQVVSHFTFHREWAFVKSWLGFWNKCQLLCFDHCTTCFNIMLRLKPPFNFKHKLFFLKSIFVFGFVAMLFEFIGQLRTFVAIVGSHWCTTKLLDGFNCEFEGKDNGRSWGVFFGSQDFEGRRACWSSGIRTRRINKQINYSHRFA
jgi:hypothetical protein